MAEPLNPSSALAQRVAALPEAADTDLLLSVPTAGVAGIRVFPGSGPELAERIARLWPPLSLPQRPGCVSGVGLELIAIAPGEWLAVRQTPEPEWLAQLAHSVSDLAAVVDQSAARELLEVSGSSARTFLQQMIPVDLHPASFGAGSSVTTRLAHFDATVWQQDVSAGFRLTVLRSYAESFLDRLELAAARSGLTLGRVSS